MSNEKIVCAWKNGKKMGKSGMRLNTDGISIYSYNLRIGLTDENNKKILFIYTAKTGNYYSPTTSRHCELIRREGADKICEMSEEDYDKYKLAPKILYDKTNLPKELCDLVEKFLI